MSLKIRNGLSSPIFYLQLHRRLQMTLGIGLLIFLLNFHGFLFDGGFDSLKWTNY